MKRVGIFKSFKVLLIAICTVLAGLVFAGCTFNKTESTYSISGFVYDERGAVEGVEIKSALGSVFTDENGKYTVSGIKESVILEPVCEGYRFAEVSKLVSKPSDNANFSANKEYTVSGYVKNNDNYIQNAKVSISSLSGNFVSMTNEDGYFESKNVAGETQISCEYEGTKFFGQTATIDNNVVDVNLTSSFTLNLNFDVDDALINYSDIKLKIGDKSYQVSSKSMKFDKIYCDTKVELSSLNYVFDESEFFVTQLNQREEINAYKIYSVNGVVKSGKTPIKDAKILVDGKQTTLTDQMGRFNLYNLVSDCNITAEYEDLVFESKLVNNTTSVSQIFNGTKSVALNFNFDYNINDSEKINFVDYDVIALENDKFTINNVYLGDEITFASNDYHLENNKIVVGSQSSYYINCFAYYDVAINGLDDIDGEYSLLLDGIAVTSLENIYGEHIVSAKFKDYVFSKKTVSFSDSVANLTYQIPYIVKFIVNSSEIELDDAFATLNGNKYFADTDNIIEIKNVVGENKIKVSCENYKDSIIEVSDKELVNGVFETSVNLTYDVLVKVKSGSVVVSNANVLASLNNGETISGTTNNVGEIKLTDLSGNAVISASKINYQVLENNINVSYNSKVTFDCTYKIFGYLTSMDSVTNAITPNVGVKINLISKNGNTIPTESDDNGYYEFNNLSGEYLLATQNVNGGPSGLKPVDGYKIIVGGQYDFNNSGYSISGKVTSNGIPVDGVFVQVGTNETYTDENGNYKFDLITGECEIKLQKDGYNFKLARDGYEFGDKVSVATDDDALNFEAAYSVNGKVFSGSKAIEGVIVIYNNKVIATTDSEGKYIANGIVGQATLIFEKTGYEFNEEVIVNSPATKNINCKLIINVYVKTGSIVVSDFECLINNETISSTGNVATISVEFGKVVEIIKAGYSISSFTVENPGDVTCDASYSVTGKVISGNEVLSNVVVAANGKSTVTNSNGEFTLTGLIGEVELEFNRANFDIDNVIVNAYVDLEIEATYNISGTITLSGNKPLANVVVTLDSKTVVTDENGRFEFESIVGKYSLNFEKTGYTFDKIENYFGSANLNISAFYTISGKVVTGDVVIAGAKISVSIIGSSNRFETTSNSNGEFIITGISGSAIINITKDGFNSFTSNTYSDYNNDVIADLSYNYTIKFSNNTTGVKLVLNGVSQIVNSSSITLKNLYGKNTINFEKTNTTFAPANLTVSAPGTITISAVVRYNIFGYIKTDKNYPVANIIVSVGSKSTTTNSEGYFEFKEVVGDLKVESNYFTTSSLSVNRDGEYKLPTISNFDFAYMLFNEGLNNLDKASSYQIFGDGQVSPQGMGSVAGTQNVKTVTRKDNNGNIIKQNLNYGSNNSLAETRVSLLTYYSKSENRWYYQHLTGGSISSNLTASHSSSVLRSQAISVADFQARYGNSPTAYLPYLITQNTIDSISGVNKSANGYSFTISLNKDASTSNYKQQMKGLSGQTVTKFYYITLNIELDLNGWLKKISVNEKYQVSTANTDIEASLNYVFKTQASNMKIDNIDISSDTAIQNSLKESAQTEIQSYSLDKEKITINVANNTLTRRKKDEEN